MIDKTSLVNAVKKFIDGEDFSFAYSEMIRAIEDYSMLDIIKRGVYVGFSGGADSVMALILLKELSKEHSFPIAAVHIEHGIRGDEAIRDMSFSEEFSEALDIPYYSFSCSVPKYAREHKMSTELAARELRYSMFESFSLNHPEYKALALAHNSTDNLETIIFNLSRGSGILGLSGIPPVRDNIIRPIIYISKPDIISLLNQYHIPYVTDSTNLSDEYTRNYIRNNIIPHLYSLAPSVERAVSRSSKNLRDDIDFIDSITKSFFDKNYKGGYILKEQLISLHPALFSRVIFRMAEEITSVCPERVHIDAIRKRLYAAGDFRIDLPGETSFVCENNACSIADTKSLKTCDLITPKKKKLTLGINILDEYGCAILLSNDKDEVFSSNVYNFSIQVGIPNDIIDEELYVRTKQDGDSYTYGGHTHKLKRLFNDKKIPKSRRENYPIVCDNSGILYVPGFSYRNNNTHGSDDKMWITVYFEKSTL